MGTKRMAESRMVKSALIGMRRVGRPCKRNFGIQERSCMTSTQGRVL